MITTERPGFGASTRLPGRGFAEPADDIAAILDHLGLAAVHVTGASGAAPHELMLAARHPDRVRAATVIAGEAPMTDAEAARVIGVNADVRRLVQSGDLDGLAHLLAQLRNEVLSDPLGSFREHMDEAPDADAVVMQEADWQASLVMALREALRPGSEGWLDECIALENNWDEIDLAAVRTSLTWWHGGSDANAPVGAAQRLLSKIPQAQLRRFSDDDGHLASYLREAEILDELLARG